MGQVIAHHALAGRQVHVVLCSSGETSAARDQINGLAPNGFWGGLHYPAREGYAPLTPDTFGLARTRELIAACAQLGVPAERVHIGPVDQDSADGMLSAYLPDVIGVDWCTQVITSWAAHFADLGHPQVGHYTMWHTDAQADHAALGRALKYLRVGNPARFGDARWLVKPEQVAAAKASAYALPSAQSAQIRLMARRAGWCYRAWQPSAGAYAIGYHSVAAYFAAVESGGPNYITAS